MDFDCLRSSSYQAGYVDMTIMEDRDKKPYSRMVMIASIIPLLLAVFFMNFIKQQKPGLAIKSTYSSQLNSDAERRTFMNRFLPAPIPEEASQIEFELEDWGEWHFTGHFKLAPESARTFMTGLQISDDGKYTLEKEAGHGTVKAEHMGLIWVFAESDYKEGPHSP